MIESELEIFDRPIDIINWIKKMSNLESKTTVNPNNISDLDKILYIKGIRDFYDVDIHQEEFDQLYHKIAKNLEWIMFQSYVSSLKIIFR